MAVTVLHATPALWVTLHHMAQAPRYNRWLIHLMRPFVGRRVLDVGCGVGTFVPMYQNAELAVALDATPALVEEARRRWGHHAHVRFLVGDITHPETVQALRRYGFDTVLLINVLEHIEEERTALEHLTVLLEPGGCLIVYVPAQPSLFGRLDEGLGHRRRYTRRGLQRLLGEAGLEVVLCRPVNMLGILGWWWDNMLRRYEAIPLWQVRLFDVLVPLWQPVEEGIRRFWSGLPGLSLLCVGRKPAVKGGTISI